VDGCGVFLSKVCDFVCGFVLRLAYVCSGTASRFG
jgi:hypothetical protein